MQANKIISVYTLSGKSLTALEKVIAKMGYSVSCAVREHGKWVAYYG